MKKRLKFSAILLSICLFSGTLMSGCGYRIVLEKTDQPAADTGVPAISPETGTAGEPQTIAEGQSSDQTARPAPESETGPDTYKPSESNTVETAALETAGQPDSSGAQTGIANETIVLYKGYDDMKFVINGLPVENKTPEAALASLIKAGVLNDTIGLLSFTQDTENRIHLDLSDDFRQQLANYGSSGFPLTMGAVIFTFLDTFKADEIWITAAGSAIMTAHGEMPDYKMRSDLEMDYQQYVFIDERNAAEGFVTFTELYTMFGDYENGDYSEELTARILEVLPADPELFIYTLSSYYPGEPLLQMLGWELYLAEDAGNYIYQEALNYLDQTLPEGSDRSCYEIVLNNLNGVRRHEGKLQ